ncbi:hypothetical protein AAMO2058_001542000 [Amorphochlora amoebiformis]
MQRCLRRAFRCSLWAGFLRNPIRRLATPTVRSDIAQKLAHPIRLPKEESNESIFLDFGTLVEAVRKEFNGELARGPRDPETAQRITQMLSSVRINPKEWEQYTHFVGGRYTRTLVGFDQSFCILLLCWEKGQESPIHCHANSSCWVKVLDGQLQESIFDFPSGKGKPLRLKQQEIFSPNQATYIDNSHGVHRMGNARSDTPCVSLHIYSPPYSQCNIYDRVTGESKLVSLGSIYDTIARPDLNSYTEWSGEEKAGILSSIDKISLDTFVERMNVELEKPLGVNANIGNILEKLTLSPDEWERFVHFGERNYTRNLLLMNEKFSVMLLCWKPGQETPPHRHGEDRHSWFKVLKGELEMVHFKDDTEDRLKLLCGEDDDYVVENQYAIDVDHQVVYEGPDDTAHKLGNQSADAPAVSIHVFSPPYLQLTYDCNNSGEEKCLPFVHYGQMFNQMLCGDRWMGADIYSNLHSFQTLLDDAFAASTSPDDPKLHRRITSLMCHIQLNPEEWRAQAQLHPDHWTRILIGQTDAWMLILTCWDKNQGTPIHDHQGSYNWIKVLEGELLEEDFLCVPTSTPAECEFDEEKRTKSASEGFEVLYEETQVQVLRSGILPKDSVTFLNSDIIHRISNISNKPAFSLHLYSPPYVKAKAYDFVSGDTSLVFLPRDQDRGEVSKSKSVDSLDCWMI